MPNAYPCLRPANHVGPPVTRITARAWARSPPRGRATGRLPFMCKALDRGSVGSMRSAASRTSRRSAGLAAMALAMLWLTTGSAAAQSCLPEPPPQQPPPPLQPPPLGAHPRVAAGVTSVSEGAGSVTFTLSLPEGQCSAQIDYQTVDGTATAGQDYGARSGSVNVDFNDPEAKVTVPIVDDALDEADETFSLQVSGGNGAGTATLVDNDPPPSVSVH